MINIKKVIITLFVISLILVISSSTKKVIIPHEAIRYRIIANSNDFLDQEQKLFINSEIEPILDKATHDAKTISDSRYNIFKSIPEIRSVINKYNIPYTVSFGNNYFPEKNYKGVTYPAGNYESLVVTLGDGLGDNWWCVLFPPLCLIEGNSENMDDVTYSLYIKDIIDNL